MRQNRMQVIVLGLAVWILSAASAGCGASPTARPLVGAIRYDGWAALAARA